MWNVPMKSVHAKQGRPTMERNKGLKMLIELKSQAMQELEASHREMMQEAAEDIKSLRLQLKELEEKDTPSV
jgi:hypothetical protein